MGNYSSRNSAPSALQAHRTANANPARVTAMAKAAQRSQTTPSKIGQTHSRAASTRDAALPVICVNSPGMNHVLRRGRLPRGALLAFALLLTRIAFAHPGHEEDFDRTLFAQAPGSKLYGTASAAQTRHSVSIT